MADDKDEIGPESVPENAASSEDHLPAERGGQEAQWELVLAEADRQRDGDAPARGTERPRQMAWATWVRVAVPIVILLVYGVYKVSRIESAPPRVPEPGQPGSLIGVQAKPDKVRLDRETTEFIERLEGFFQLKNWSGMAAAIAKAPDATREHPVVRAFDAIARVQQGEVSGTLRTEIRKLLPLFEHDGSLRLLYEYLLLADATMQMRAVYSSAQALREIDYFRRVLREQAEMTTEQVNLRVLLARRYARLADSRLAEAGTFRVDKAAVAEARSLYQNALRWLTVPEGWTELRPVSRGEPAALRDQVLVQLRSANEKFHGLMLPVGGNDNETWTGRAGDPPHDVPGGTW